MNNPSPLDGDENRIIRLDGVPKDQNRRNEPHLWRRFLKAVWPFAQSGGAWAKYGSELGVVYAEAEVANRVNAADKIAAEAAEASARADENRQSAVKNFNLEVDAIFMEDGLPEAAKMLKLAKLLEANPDIAEQIDKVSGILEKLCLTRGTRVKIGMPDVEEPMLHRDG